MSDNLVSVVIPTYNCGPFLRRAIQSVINQTHKELEIIVIDNNSVDNTDEIIARFNESRIIYLKVNNDGVIARSRNHGLRLAKGKWVAFLDADDWWMPEKLELSIEVLKSGADIVYHDLVRAGTRRNFLSKNIISSRKVSRPVFQNLVEKGNALLNSSVVIRRDIAKEVGELSEAPQLVGGEDLEYWLRISKITENFSRIPQALGYYWIGNSNTFSPERAISSLTELRKNHFGSSNKSNSPVWVAFALAKANYLLAQHDDALMELSSIKFRNQNLSYFFKIIVLKLLIFVERRFGFNLRSYMR